MTKRIAYSLSGVFSGFGWLVSYSSMATGVFALVRYFDHSLLDLFPTFVGFLGFLFLVIIVPLAVSLWMFGKDGYVRALQLDILPKRFPIKLLFFSLLVLAVSQYYYDLPQNLVPMASVVIEELSVAALAADFYFLSGLLLFYRKRFLNPFNWAFLVFPGVAGREMMDVTYSSDFFQTLGSFVNYPVASIRRFVRLLPEAYQIVEGKALYELPRLRLRRLASDFAIFELCMLYGTEQERTALAELYQELSKLVGPILPSTEGQFRMREVIAAISKYRLSVPSWEEFMSSNSISGSWKQKFVPTRDVSRNGSVLIALGCMTVLAAAFPIHLAIAQEPNTDAMRTDQRIDVDYQRSPRGQYIADSISIKLHAALMKTHFVTTAMGKIGSDVLKGGSVLGKMKGVAKKLAPDKLTIRSGPLLKGFGEIAAEWEKSEGRRLTAEERREWFEAEMDHWLDERAAERQERALIRARTEPMRAKSPPEGRWPRQKRTRRLREPIL